MAKKRKKGSARGFPKFIVLQFHKMKIDWYIVYSKRIDKIKLFNMGKKWSNASDNEKYALFESVFQELKRYYEKGIRTLIILANNYPKVVESFQDHLYTHHKWIFNPSLDSHTLQHKTLLTPTDEFNSLELYFLEEEAENQIISALNNEFDSLITILEEYLRSENGVVGVTLKEIENILLPKKKHRKTWAEYLLINETFLEDSPNRIKNRIHRIIQIAENKDVKVRILLNETPASERLDQLGGAACFLKIDPRFEQI